MNVVDIARRAAQAAAAEIANSMSADHRRPRNKGDIELVTDVDARCEARIREVLAAHTPDIPVLGEEAGGAVGAATRWIVDPIDGTTNFVHGFPWFAVSIALEVDGVLEAGVILDPLRRTTYHAARGGGAYCNDERIHVSTTQTLADALLATGFPYDRRERLDALLEHVKSALLASRGLRRAGAASLDLAMVACGAIDAYWEIHLKPWDIAAGVLLVREAGGRCTSLDDTSLTSHTPSPLATNGLLHDAMLELLSR
jgi:myo-inositol-1(or 4)-monophosphatase